MGNRLLLASQPATHPCNPPGEPARDPQPRLCQPGQDSSPRLPPGSRREMGSGGSSLLPAHPDDPVAARTQRHLRRSRQQPRACGRQGGGGGVEGVGWPRWGAVEIVVPDAYTNEGSSQRLRSPGEGGRAGGWPHWGGVGTVELEVVLYFSYNPVKVLAGNSPLPQIGVQGGWGGGECVCV